MNEFLDEVVDVIKEKNKRGHYVPLIEKVCKPEQLQQAYRREAIKLLRNLFWDYCHKCELGKFAKDHKDSSGPKDSATPL